MSFLVCSCLFFCLFHAHDVHVFRRRSSLRMISSSPVWWPVAWRFPYPWIACHATSLCSFRSSNWHRTTSGGCAFSSKLVSSQVCFNHLQVLQVNQPQINSVRSNEKERMSKPVNFFSELPLRRTHRRANVKTWFHRGSVLPFVFPPVVRQVIELVLRAEEGLHRDVVKHLAQAEEKVLESLAWTGDSPLWEELRANEGPLPSCQQVGSKTHKITSVTYSRFPSRWPAVAVSEWDEIRNMIKTFLLIKWSLWSTTVSLHVWI